MDRMPEVGDRSAVVPIKDLEKALLELELRPLDWYCSMYGDTYRLCLESEVSRRLLWAVCQHVGLMLRLGADHSIPLILLAATMLQAGYTIGRKQAESEILEGWLKL